MTTNFKYLLLLLTLVTLHLRSCTGDDDQDDFPLVRVKQGLIKGIKETSLGGKEFFSYMSIPYAQPPTGKLRFKDPVPLQSWDGVLDGSKMPVCCLQSGLMDTLLEDKVSSTLQGKEDCLFLNVFTNSPNKPEKKLPVMVFIHGGGFVFGGAHEYHPHVFMDKDIILVVIQYRLGIFGFLSTEDSVMPGNMGLKDQQLALKWIKENIEAFGGDPDTITIFGESAGGVSVHYQILSPGSEGLFQRAILQSGNAFSPWASNENHKQFAIETGKQFNCSIDFGTETFLECMQNVNPLYLLIAATNTPVWFITPYFVLPRVDGDFISEAPEILMKKGKFNKVDIMAGITRDEGAIVELMTAMNPSLNKKLNENFDEFGPLSLARHNEPNAVELATQIYKYYLKRDDITVKDTDSKAIVKLHTDNYFQDSYDLSSYLFVSSDVKVYLYQLNHVGKGSFDDFLPGFDKENFISHGDDMPYMFEGGPMFSATMDDEEDLKLREIILSYWTTFAKTGNPNTADSDIWKRASMNNFKHLSLTPNPQMEDDAFKGNRMFWASLKTKQNANIIKAAQELKVEL